MAASDRPAGSDPGAHGGGALSQGASSLSDRDANELLFARTLLAAAPIGIWAVDREGRSLFHNELFRRLLGFTDTMLHEQRAGELFEHIRTQAVNPDALSAMVHSVQEGERESWQGTIELHDGRLFEVTVRLLRREHETVGRIWLLRDVTGQRRSQEALRTGEANLRTLVHEQERLIATIREIGTPVLPIYNRILVLPIVGHMEQSRSAHLMESLLEAIQRHQASVVIIDITGVSLVDTSVANSLIQSTQAAALLGAHCVLVGISAAVARTIVQLGVDLSQITTRRDLQAGIAFALRRIGYAITLTREEPDWLVELDLGDGKNDGSDSHGEGYGASKS